jgi:hypothetical protein|tara:strand:+ start:81 stop:320 length:240 start_codon:yes stop_codon:yes gene_type:complete
MAKKENTSKDLGKDDIEFESNDEGFSAEDYIFVCTPNGELKEVVFPVTDSMRYPAKLLEVFEHFGIDDPDSLLVPKVLH